jgi:hypothetical protein
MPITTCKACGYSYSEIQSTFCPHQLLVDKPVELPKAAPVAFDRIRVALKSGRAFDMTCVGDFNMLTFVGNIRSSGYLLNDRCYTTHDQIECIFTWLSTQGEPGKNDAPVYITQGPETKQ